MKVKLKIAPELLFLLHQLVLSELQKSKNKVDRSMKQELFEELYRRCKSYTRNPNGKPRALSLWYHLAECLFSIVMNHHNSPYLGAYENNQLELIKNELHKKML